MKKLISIMIIITIISSFASCSNHEEKKPKTTVQSADTQESWCRYQSGNTMVETDDSVYIMRNGYLFVVDKESHKCAPLCNKPNCMHEEEDLNTSCNAYIENEAESCIALCDNRLFFLNVEYKMDKDGNEITYYKITKSKLDGTAREDVFSTSELFIHYFKIHRGYIYLYASTFDEDGSSSDETAWLYRLKLGDKKPEKLKIPHFGDDKYLFSDLRFYKDSMYILFDRYVSDSESDKYIAVYNLKTNQLKEISDNFKPKSTGDITIMKNNLYYISESALYKADLDGKNSKRLLNCKTASRDYPIFSLANNDGKRISIVCKKKKWWTEKDFGNCALIFADENGKAEFYDLPVKTEPYIGGNPDFTLSFQSVYGGGADDKGTRQLYFIDKKKLGDKNCVSDIYTFKD